MEERNLPLIEREISKELFREEVSNNGTIYIYPEVHEYQIIPILAFLVDSGELIVARTKLITEKYKLIENYVKKYGISKIYSELPPKPKMKEILHQIENLSSYVSDPILSLLLIKASEAIFNIYKISYERLKRIAKKYGIKLEYLDNDELIEKMKTIATEYSFSILSAILQGAGEEKPEEKTKKYLRSIVSISEEREEVWKEKLLEESENVLVICGAYHAPSLAKKLEQNGRKVVILEPTEVEKELTKMFEKIIESFSTI